MRAGAGGGGVAAKTPVTGTPGDAGPATGAVAAPPQLLVRELSKSYGSVPVLHASSVTASRGEIIALLGPSGCGKTTLLRCIAGLEVPNGGRITVAGKTVYDGAASISVPPEERRLGLVFQSYAIWPHMTVRENVGYGLKLRKVGKKERQERVDYILNVMGMLTHAERHPGQLSGGQQQRVAVARSVVTEPQVLLLDEPFSNLDAAVREQMREYLRSVVKRLGITSVLVTHDREEALVFADRICVMADGEITESGPPRQLYLRPQTRRASAALGYANVIEIERCEKRADGTFSVSVPGLPEPLQVDVGDSAAHQKTLDDVSSGKARASLMIRPEEIELSPASRALSAEERANTIAGVIRTAFFVGRSHVCEVAVNDSIHLRVESRKPYKPSDHVHVQLQRGSLTPIVG